MNTFTTKHMKSPQTEGQYILVDIRSDSEVYNRRIDPAAISKLPQEQQNYSVYNIPMNMIRFNRDTIIQHLAWVDKIIIICNSGRRSGFIKQKYFADQPNIVTDTAIQFNNLNTGLNIVNGNQPETAGIVLALPVWSNPNPRIYSITRLIQILLGSVILVSVLGTLWQLGWVKKSGAMWQLWGLYILLVFGAMALYNGLSGTCTLSLILQDYLN